jgi:hypothetical protein
MYPVVAAVRITSGSYVQKKLHVGVGAFGRGATTMPCSVHGPVGDALVAYAIPLSKGHPAVDSGLDASATSVTP